MLGAVIDALHRLDRVRGIGRPLTTIEMALSARAKVRSAAVASVFSRASIRIKANLIGWA
jgi:hypothetical protein